MDLVPKLSFLLEIVKGRDMAKRMEYALEDRVGEGQKDDDEKSDEEVICCSIVVSQLL